MVISVDFDGTLALGDTASIPTMKPNISLINILNKMYNDGNIINIVTARGSKSCKTFEDRRKKYFKIIQSWLEENKVKYHNISFFKEYADIYFDDKCHNINLSINYEKLDSIFTKNSVRRLNDYVVKSCRSSQSESLWYREASKIKIFTAEVLSYDSDTITTKYISGSKFDDHNLSFEILKKFKENKSLNNICFSSYIERIKNHACSNKNILNIDRFIKKMNSISVPSSFNHGDFSVHNMIQKDKKLFLIDPIYSSNLFQSYFIDAAKHLMSILYYDLNYDLYEKCKALYLTLDIPEDVLNILICSESIRVSSYKKQFSNISNNLLQSF